MKKMLSLILVLVLFVSTLSASANDFDYPPDLTIEFEGTLVIEGTPLVGNDLEFEVIDLTGDQVAFSTNDSTGKIQFLFSFPSDFFSDGINAFVVHMTGTGILSLDPAKYEIDYPNRIILIEKYADADGQAALRFREESNPLDFTYRLINGSSCCCSCSGNVI